MNQQNKAPKDTQEVLLQLVQQIKDPLEAIMIANKGVAEKLFGATSNQVSTVTLQNSRKISALIEEVVKKIRADTKKEKEPLIFNIYKNNERVQAICSKEIDPKMISKTDKAWLIDLEKVVLNEPNPDQLSLFGLAFEVSVSERQLHRNVKRFLNITPNKYIRILKLHKAKQLLEEYAYRTISEVAYAVGFSDAHYFSNIFYRQYGVMPKDVLPV